MKVQEEYNILTKAPPPPPPPDHIGLKRINFIMIKLLYNFLRVLQRYENMDTALRVGWGK